MNSSSELLTKTLIQRGESDNYIRERLLQLGLNDADAKQLIRESRQYHGAEVATYPLISPEMLVIVSLALMVFLAWLLLSGVLF